MRNFAIFAVHPLNGRRPKGIWRFPGVGAVTMIRFMAYGAYAEPTGYGFVI
jgi:hypothetical protein